MPGTSGPQPGSTRPAAPTSVAVLYAGLGDTIETFAWLRRAIEERDRGPSAVIREGR